MARKPALTKELARRLNRFGKYFPDDVCLAQVFHSTAGKPDCRFGFPWFVMIRGLTRGEKSAFTRILKYMYFRKLEYPESTHFTVGVIRSMSVAEIIRDNVGVRSALFLKLVFRKGW